MISPNQTTRASAAAAALVAATLWAVAAFAQGAGSAPQFEPVEAPLDQDSGIFVSQIGSSNEASAQQDGNAASTQVAQQGEGNRAAIRQSSAPHYAAAAQNGNLNEVDIAQDGNGQTALVLAQQGNGNVADILQREAGLAYSAGAISQTGDSNSLSLIQDGSDNQARLTQAGDGNAMTASQLGANNRLDWSQVGSGLSDLQIEQTGGAGLIVIQTNGGG
ncbi:hypothetical protein K3177_03515 [Qipengyuania sp. GH25]|uniref:Curlin associated repeat-containing protein n=1 Tax=Qipengyuania pacifica TaxID=2860199 RepID=A0ABS7JC23_9SPHN|nr:hypothetical protein [Qipengyuania aerophila]MBX7487575.1 hypothetical protein [Qipengyuania aerophila]